MFSKLSTLSRVLVVTEILCCRHRLWATFELFVAHAGAQAHEHRLTACRRASGSLPNIRWTAGIPCALLWE